MHRILSMSVDAALAALVLIPLFLYLDRRYFHHKARTWWYIFFSVYLSGMFSVVGLPDICYFRFDPHFNFTPFAYMFSDYTNSLLNVLLFFPMGVLLPVLWPRFKAFHRTILFGFFCSLLIEILQIFTYRATDVNDLITNTAGTFLGWSAARIGLHFLHQGDSFDARHELTIVCASAFGVMFFVQPFLSLLVCEYIYPYI